VKGVVVQRSERSEIADGVRDSAGKLLASAGEIAGIKKLSCES